MERVAVAEVEESSVERVAVAEVETPKAHQSRKRRKTAEDDSVSLQISVPDISM